MNSSREKLRELLANGRIRVKDADLLHEEPGAPGPGFDFSRVAGMMLGLAIGDALGNGIEGAGWYLRKSERGAVRDYVYRPGYSDARGYPSDDSQLAFWTLEQALEDGRFVPDRLIDTFCSREIVGIGSTVAAALDRRRAGRPWHECGLGSAGNGALMRIAPVLIPHLGAPSPGLWADAALCTILTHNDSMAIASSIAFVRVLWQLLGMSGVPAAEWWLEAFLSALRQLEMDESYVCRSPAMVGFEGPLWKFLEQEVAAAYRYRPPISVATCRWYSGAYLLETVPSVLYILMRHAGDPEKALVSAVNDCMDSDTAGAIVGAAVGALHGTAGLPDRWLKQLSGRTRAADDGCMFELLNRAEERFGPQGHTGTANG